MATGNHTERLQDRAERLTEDAQEKMTDAAREQGEHARDAAVEQADHVADAARDAGEHFESSSLQAEALRAVSQKVEAFTRQLRDRPIDELVDDAAVFARRNPLLVLGGAAILGFAAARFLKAEPQEQFGAADDPWSSVPADRSAWGMS